MSLFNFNETYNYGSTHDYIGIVESDKYAIPDDIHSFFEGSMYLAESVNSNYNIMMKSIAINEAMVLESTGSEIIYEGNALSALKDKVKKLFIAIWAKIKALFEKIYAWFEKKRKEFVKKLGNKVNEKLYKIDMNKSFGEVHLDNLTKAIDVDVESYYTGVLDELKAVYKNADDVSKSMQGYKDNAKSEIDDKYTDNYIIAKLTLGYKFNKGTKDFDNVGEYIKALKEFLIGDPVEVKGDYIMRNFSDIKDTVVAGKGYKKTIKTTLKTCKDMVNNEINAITKDMTEESSFLVSSMISACKKLATDVTMLSSMKMDLCKMKYHESSKLFYKAVFAKKDKSLSESTMFESFQADMINDSFDW